VRVVVESHPARPRTRDEDPGRPRRPTGNPSPFSLEFVVGFASSPLTVYNRPVPARARPPPARSRPELRTDLFVLDSGEQLVDRARPFLFFSLGT